MNRAIATFLTLSFTVLVLSNFTADKQSTFVMTAVGSEPVLPEVPYVYAISQLPEYLAIVASSAASQTPVPADPVPYYVAPFVQTVDISTIDENVATLGRVLFYDKKLSAMENISCGSCHDQSLSFAENKSLSEGIDALTQRNAMHLNDLGWSNSRRFSWNMEQTSLQEMLFLPLTDQNEIGVNNWELGLKLESTSYYPDLFEKAYGSSYVTINGVLDALNQFIMSMNTFNSRFDQNVPTLFQEFSESEQRGMAIFQTSCTGCHKQGNISALGTTPPPSSINNNGLPPDAEDAGAGDWNNAYVDLFKLTTLRNIELTAPYMHDGRFDSLEEVVEHYSSGVVANEHTTFLLPDGGYDFDDQEKEDLVAFMKTLTDNTFSTNPKWSDPFADGVLGSSNVNHFEDLVLRPNPMADRAVIEFKNDNNLLVSINILTSDGRLLKHDSTRGSQYALEKSTFGEGIYYIELIRDDAKSVQKLIVQ